MQRGRLLIILGVVLGLLTLGAVAFLVVGGGLLAGGGGAAPTPTTAAPVGKATEIPTTNVIVALQPIPRGSQFVEGAIGPRPWPVANVPPNGIQDPIETIGKVAKTEIYQGQIILRDMLTSGTEEASFKIPPGRVAVAYPINRQSSVAYAIKPDDYVDILITGNFRDIDEEFQTSLPNKFSFISVKTDATTGEVTYVLTPPQDEGRFATISGDFPAVVYARQEQIPRRVAQLTVSAAKIVKIGTWLIEQPPAPPSDQAPPPQSSQGTPVPTPTPPLPDLVTLAVTPQDALVLLWIRQSFIYSEMALRAAGEENADHQTEAVTLQYMLTRFNISVPPKIEFSMEPSIIDLARQGMNDIADQMKKAQEVQQTVQQSQQTPSGR